MILSNATTYAAGQALSTPRLLYSHVGIATDHMKNGEQLVISCSGKSGKVVLEPLSEFSAGRGVKRIPAPSALAPDQALRRAYSMLGKPYSIRSFNCEHFLNVAYGLAPKSPQFAIGVLTLLGFLLLR